MKQVLFFLVCIFLILLHKPLYSQPSQKLRVIVLTDIEADPDDAQSMIRFLTYSNQWDVEGLIATTSIHQKKRVAPETIEKILVAYGKVQPNLMLHEKGFPTYDQLKSKVKKGNPVYGMEGVGEGKDSQGSDWIIQMLEKPDTRPVWFSVWGGSKRPCPGTLENPTYKKRFGSIRALSENQGLYDLRPGR